MEIGSVVRLLLQLPQSALNALNISDYLQNFPGLNEELKKRHAELQDFKDCY